MRFIPIGLSLLGCGWLSYQSLMFAFRVDSIIEDRVHTVQRFQAQLSTAQAVTFLRDMNCEIDSFRPAVWPGVVVALIGSALFSWRSSVKREVRELAARTGLSAPPKLGPATPTGSSNVADDPPSVG